MIKVNIDEATTTLRSLAEGFSDRQLVVANTRAINVAIRKSNTQYRREIVNKYNLKYADTKSLAVQQRASYSTPVGTISGETKPISISRFNPTFNKGGEVTTIKNLKDKSSGKRGLKQSIKKAGKKDSTEGGVSFTIRKGETKNIPFAFMIKNSSKAGLSMQVWARGEYKGNNFVPSKSRKPITPLKTASPFGMMTLKPIQKTIEQSATSDMQKEYERQINLLIQRVASK